MRPQRKTRICDECKKSIATIKCQICDKDLCEPCSDKAIFTFYISGNMDAPYITSDDEIDQVNALITLAVCKRCAASLKKNEKDIYESVQSSKQFKAFFNILRKASLRLTALNPAEKKRSLTRAIPAIARPAGFFNDSRSVLGNAAVSRHQAEIIKNAFKGYQYAKHGRTKNKN